MCSEQDPLAHFKNLKMGIFVFFLTAERDWSQECCHGNNIVGVSFMMYIPGAKFEEHCFKVL